MEVCDRCKKPSHGPHVLVGVRNVGSGTRYGKTRDMTLCADCCVAVSDATDAIIEGIDAYSTEPKPQVIYRYPPSIFSMSNFFGAIFAIMALVGSLLVGAGIINLLCEHFGK